MITVSLCMIVRDEEDTLERCLSSVVSAVDEIIIVDTGSTDQTRDIAGRFTDQIYDFKWIDDFAAARNYAFDLATKDYILWLDADDLMQEEACNKLIRLKETLDPTIDSVTMDYLLAFDEYGNATSSVRRNRLVKRQNHFRWIGAVHEYLEVWGNILHSDIEVTHCSIRHDSDRNITIYEKRLSAGESFSPRDLYYYANELVDHRRFKEAIRYYRQFLDSRQGWMEDNISACGRLADCFHELGDREQEYASILRSFQYDRPRAEFCCRLGYHFLQSNEIQTSIFWYKLATTLERPKDHLGFHNRACSTWLPHLQLCVCYDRMGDLDSAYHHNEIARSYHPTDSRIVHNKQYLETMIESSKGEQGHGTGDAVRVLIGSPVHQKPAILREFLSSLRRLSDASIEFSYYFIDDNQDTQSSAMLRDFACEVPRVTIHRTVRQHEYIRDEDTHCWNEQLIWNVAELKNRIIKQAVDQEFDFLFVVDSDLVLHTKTVEQLVAAGKDIISEIFWTRWRPESEPLPQVWLRDEYMQWEQHRGETLSDSEIAARQEQFLSRLTIPGVYEVGGLGACTLISRRALTSGVDFKPIKNLSFWGEDRHFCVRAAALGFPLFVDTHYPAYHIYRESDLQGVSEWVSRN
ncbi:glycosyltransferase [Paenibacillus aurantiacus]|uniref:Glycosyltransferase n=1 Tax=Paenibacillus aurantiacus TaxID=1936118 RepID=A0ABV5L043_9BACL